MRHVETPLAKGSARLREGLMMQLHEFAELLEKNMLVAVNAADDERGLEGNYWLALLLGPWRCVRVPRADGACNRCFRGRLARGACAMV